MALSESEPCGTRQPRKSSASQELWGRGSQLPHVQRSGSLAPRTNPSRLSAAEQGRPRALARLPLHPPQHQEQAQPAGSAGLGHGEELQQGEGRKGRPARRLNQQVEGRRKLPRRSHKAGGKPGRVPSPTFPPELVKDATRGEQAAKHLTPQSVATNSATGRGVGAWRDRHGRRPPPCCRFLLPRQPAQALWPQPRGCCVLTLAWVGLEGG